ncbi:hypothetical protein BG011_002554 [Mortierella polycephala]|uniref:Yeast cell wall synthesis Kre9/Knh1-like N-terminal domain-containing protein n=1 Tax=Mortierella polycephala TaxID=41804 RepID=A0A9P6U543_9FUNG|nr:hypothetical protein BG011_002554 [Mortierella polycephala]
MKFLTILAAVAISAVAAQTETESKGRLYYTEPVGATVWTAGQNHTVSWSNECDPLSYGKLHIALYLGTGGKEGTEQALVPGVDAIGTVDCEGSQTATVFLPATLVTSDKYSIHVSTKPDQSYSAQFTIKGVDPVTTAPAPGATTTTAAGTASASASASASATPSTGADKDADTENAAGSLKAVGSTFAVLAAVGSMFL